MSGPSRPFILRPVATTLADGRHPAGRRRGLQAAAGLRAAGGRLPDHPGHDVLPGCEPRCHGVVGDGAARAPVRPGAGPQADDVDQLSGQLGHHAAVQPEPEHRRGRAGGPGSRSTRRARFCRPTCRRRPSTARSIRPTPRFSRWRCRPRRCRCRQVEDLADTRLAPRRSRSCRASACVSISGGQKPAVRIQANPTALASCGLNLEDLRTALIAANVNQAKGSFDGPHQSYQIGANDQLHVERRTTGPWWSPTGTVPRSS